LILYGRVVDTVRAKEAFGFAPRYTTESALKDFRDRHHGELEPTPSVRPNWEKELFEYLRAKSKESV
jgi:hypothetical protein